MFKSPWETFRYTCMTLVSELPTFHVINFRNRNIQLVPLSADAPRRPTNLQRVAIMEHTSGPLPPPAAAGSASNPIYVGSPDTAIVVAGPAQNPVTPTPPTRPFRIPVAIPIRKVARGETRIRRRPKRSASNTTAMTAPAPSSAPPAPGGATSGFPTTAAPTTAPTTAAPTVVTSTVASTTVASTVAASGSTSGAAPTTGVSTAFSSSTASAAAPGDACTHAPTVDASNSGNATNASYGTVDGTQRVIDVSDFSDIEPSRQVPQKRQAQDIIPQINVHDSDSDGPDFLPSYPQERGGDSSHVCRTTTPPTTDRTSSISTSTSSPLTELGPTAPSTPKSGQKVFQPLFSIGGISCKGKGKGKGKGKAKESSPVTEHLLHSNKRYKLTDAGRSLCLSGADPSSLCTNIPTADGADPVAGPSSVPANGAPTVDGPPIAGPSNCRVSNTSIEDGNDGDDEGDSLVSNEYAHWDFNSDEIDEVGRIMEEVEGAWKHCQAKRNHMFDIPLYAPLYVPIHAPSYIHSLCCCPALCVLNPDSYASSVQNNELCFEDLK
ncbi:hypothetical protein BDN70DRAFT_901996 [Pholiota conissans]|uniref:Uncharacterized protein n=1 Tax=Pholiota conissans TaxID=109636 RepID=A0A9P5YKR5_9AGAR|nr:hypothetical protein BDN70DRAFT_901996 [Pholiota conissans]